MSKIINYQLNVTSLLKKQDDFRKQAEEQEALIAEQGQKNKLQLLKYVLPYMHGVFAIHNHRCYRRISFGLNYKGLLGYGQRDIDKELEHIVNTDMFLWEDNFQTFKCRIGTKGIKIWLNSREGAFVATPHLPYSMTSLGMGIYGESIEKELEILAQYCSTRFKDEW